MQSRRKENPKQTPQAEMTSIGVNKTLTCITHCQKSSQLAYVVCKHILSRYPDAFHPHVQWRQYPQVWSNVTTMHKAQRNNTFRARNCYT